ncbi:MAG: ABC transporter permease [Acidobacteria bacterium]|nr:MAG: ABC transporter permease [Acidobacteriota bacterium]
MKLGFPVTIIAFFVLLGLLADLIAPYPYSLQNRRAPFHPPTRIHLFHEGRLNFPYVNPYELKDPLFKVYERKEEVLCRLKFFSNTPYGLKLLSVEEPCNLYLLGTDKLGRDVFSRLVYGARVSLLVGLVGITVTFILGSLIGGLSGYLGGRVDTFIMRVVEVLLAIPTFYLMLSLRSVFPLTMESLYVFLMVVFILSFIGWAGLARVVRGMVLSIREREFVQAARAYGTGTLRLLRVHILPNTYYYLIVSATLSFPGYVLAEASLSFLGLGIQEPYPSWGNMLSDARNVNLVLAHPWILAPGMALFLLVIAFNLLGDELLKRRS